MLEKLRSIICDYVDVAPADITESASLRNDLGATSFDLMNIAVALEDEFGVSITNETLAGVHNVGELIPLLQAS